jgi:hypothetical protein
MNPITRRDTASTAIITAAINKKILWKYFIFLLSSFTLIDNKFFRKSDEHTGSG